MPIGTLQHLSSDDLFAPLTEPPSLGGTGPFVINLSSSAVPISLPSNGIAVAANTRVYQIRCMEDRRVRYRLRMGPFTSEAQADAVLKVVRDNYPAALTATATGDDLETLATLQLEVPKQAIASIKPAAPKLPASAVPRLSVSDTVTATAPAKVPAAPEPVRKPALQSLAPPAETSSRNRRLVVPTLSAAAAAPAPSAAAPVTLQPAPKAAVPPVLQARSSVPAAHIALQIPAKPAMPPVVQAKIPAPAAELPSKSAAAPASRTVSPMPATPNSLQPSSAVSAATARASAVAAPQPTAAQVAQNFVAAIAAKSAAPAPVKPKSAPAAGATTAPGANALKAPINAASVVTAARPAPPAMNAKIDAPAAAPVKSATAAVASDSARWFVVELSSSDRPFDPDAVPNLDIFSVYRLYSLESVELGTVTHALRLGFFTEEFAAKAVSDYLADHYEAPVVKRVNGAERDRFTERPMEARKTVEATGRHAMIEITDERYVRELRLTTV